MSDESQAQAEMPRYKCHKEVWALKIRMITQDPQTDRVSLVFEEPGYAPLLVDEVYLNKHKPQAGGYYVVYDDGYKSWSPAKAFEDGYTRI